MKPAKTKLRTFIELFIAAAVLVGGIYLVHLHHDLLRHTPGAYIHSPM